MPIYEYLCRNCNHEFEALIYGTHKAECPKCHSRKLAPRLSVFAVAGKSSSFSPEGARSETGGACGSCGDPRGPGACSMPDFD